MNAAGLLYYKAFLSYLWTWLQNNDNFQISLVVCKVFTTTVSEKIQKYRQATHATGNAGMWQGNYETDRKRMKIKLRLQKG